METEIYCLVDPHGHVHSDDAADSYAAVAERFGLNEAECQKYRFDLTTRRVVADHATPAGAIAIQAYLNQRFGTPEQLMHVAADGHLTKQALLDLLDIGSRRAYLDACAAIDRHYTDDCADTGDPCLASGCSIDRPAGEVCLQPTLRAGTDYQKVCGAEWVKIFRSPEHRIAPWKH